MQPGSDVSFGARSPSRSVSSVGDVGYLNEEGYLFICDRKIDMIITGGAKVYLAEVERALVLHPAVADCAVFGVPHPLLGESIRAAVELHPAAAARPPGKLFQRRLRDAYRHGGCAT